MHKQELIINHFNLGISEVERYALGVVENLLDTLPVDVWSNMNLTFGNFSVEIGNFQAVILNRLMIGLKDVIKDARDRYKHIMENMIYTCDISSKNTFLYYNIFDEENELDINYYKGSFLEKEFNEHMKNVWGIEKFDIVVCKYKGRCCIFSN